MVVSGISRPSSVTNSPNGEISKEMTMKKSAVYRSLALVLIALSIPGVIQNDPAHAQTATAAGKSEPAGIQIPNAPITTRVVAQSPAETDTELQIICLFESVPENAVHGALAEMNEKLKGLLDKIRTPTLFRGELGETVLIVPPAGSLRSRNLLIIGLGDSRAFTPQRMELVGSIAYTESNRLKVAHPFFAPTVLDGGVSKYTTGEVSEEFTKGFIRAARTEKNLEVAGVSKGQVIQDLAYLAGPTHVTDTQKGIERAVATAGN
jgi:hypothetical protein